MTRVSFTLASVLIAFTLPAIGGAQAPEPAPAPTPAKGPADLINRARAERDRRDLADAPATKQTPTADAKTAPASGEDPHAANPHAADPHATNPHAANPHAAGPHGGGTSAPAPISTRTPNPALAMGTIRVKVVDEVGRPVASTDVRIGVLHSDSKRSEKRATTNAEGFATFAGLATGSQQAYRASVDHEGARYGSMPFRLEERTGYDVVLRRLPTTQDDARLVLYMGATSVELKDERISVVQQARLLNIDPLTYVFPEGGKLIRLPRGFTAFQSQDTMGDQRVEEAPGEGLRIAGSIPPGEATLTWGFDLPIEGSELDIAAEIPWKTFAYRVIADAAPGLQVSVEGMPTPRLHEDGGRRFYVTEMQRRIGDDPFMHLRVRLSGIPGPGPLRWIAAGIALAALGLGFLLSRRSPETGGANAVSTQAGQEALRARAAELDALRERGEIGPGFHEDERQKLVDELAALLWEEEERKRAAAKGENPKKGAAKQSAKTTPATS